MPVPTNRQEFPAPHRDWRGANEVDAAPQRGMAKIARLWAPLRAVLEHPFATLCRVALRVVDRETGIPYSADELSAKILEDVGDLTEHTHTSADITDRTPDGATNPGKILRTSASLLEGPVGGVTVSSISLVGIGASLVRYPTTDEFYYDDQTYNQTRPRKSGAIVIAPIYSSLEAAVSDGIQIGDVWWDSINNKARTRLS